MAKVKQVADRSTEQPFLDLDTFMPHQLAVLSRLTQLLLADALSECSMTIAQWRVLLCLIKRGPSSLNAIVDFTKLPQSSLSRSIAKMHEKDWVQNLKDMSDRRFSAIEITPAGREKMDVAIGIATKRCDQALDLPPQDRERFCKTVENLIDRLS